MIARPSGALKRDDPVDPDGLASGSAALADVDGLHRLACEPLIDRYLFDGTAPEADAIADAIARAMADAARTGLGLWILQSPRVPYGGCLQLQPDPSAKSAELIYLPTHGATAWQLAWARPQLERPFSSSSMSLSPEPIAPTGFARRDAAPRHALLS